MLLKPSFEEEKKGSNKKDVRKSLLFHIISHLVKQSKNYLLAWGFDRMAIFYSWSKKKKISNKHMYLGQALTNAVRTIFWPIYEMVKNLRTVRKGICDQALKTLYKNQHNILQ